MPQACARATLGHVKNIRFWFDVISPYAYVAWTQMGAVARTHRRELVPIPVLLAAVLDAHGTKGPAEIPAKRRYLFRDVARKAHRLGVPLRAPVAHPFNPLVALRVATVSPTAAVIDALFAAFWANRRAIDTAEAVRGVLRDAGLDPALVDAAGEDPAKLALRKATADAVAEGVFGVPTVEADGEMFWGTDALVDLEELLAGRSPDLPGFDDIPVAATRRTRS